VVWQLFHQRPCILRSLAAPKTHDWLRKINPPLHDEGYTFVSSQRGKTHFEQGIRGSRGEIPSRHSTSSQAVLRAYLSLDTQHNAAAPTKRATNIQTRKKRLWCQNVSCFVGESIPSMAKLGLSAMA